MAKADNSIGIKVNIGSSETKIIVNGPNGMIHSQTARVGSDAMDDAITRYVEQQYKLQIGSLTAEAIRTELGLAAPPEMQRTMKIRARRIPDSEPEVAYITDDDISKALAEAIDKITEAVLSAVKNIPSEMLAAVKSGGIVLVGAFLRNIDQPLMRVTGMPMGAFRLKIRRPSGIGLLRRVISRAT